MKDKLDRVAALVGGGELERDLALQLLREVYAEIKFGASEPGVAVAAVATEPVSTTEAVDEAALEGEDCGAPEIVAEESAAEPEEVAVQETATEPIETATEAEEPAVEERGEAEEVPVVAPRRVSADVIRSLYGTEAEETESEPMPQPEPEQQPEPQPKYEPQPAPAPQPQPKQEPKPEPNGHTILADVVSDGRRTLGETLKGGERDMATHIAASEQRGLRGSIGLNDRFLVIRDMFDGDAAAFDAAIDRLDGFTDLDEAVIWIRDNFDRSAENRGMQLLVSLVERKLGR